MRSGTRKMSSLAWFESNETYWMAIGNRESALLECAQRCLLLM